jgi:hypothetical protein
VTETSTGAPGEDKGLRPTEAPTARLFLAVAGGSTVPLVIPWVVPDADDGPVLDAPVLLLLPLAVLLLVPSFRSPAAVLLSAPVVPKPAAPAAPALAGGPLSNGGALLNRRLLRPGTAEPTLLLLSLLSLLLVLTLLVLVLALPVAVPYLEPLGSLSLLLLLLLLLVS